ncbi:hypothetical protein Lal_00031469 [Lupinus albus]|nr:hypothetical protein Lal_00031469 [Lupinus albus]
MGHTARFSLEREGLAQARGSEFLPGFYLGISLERETAHLGERWLPSVSGKLGDTEGFSPERDLARLGEGDGVGIRKMERVRGLIHENPKTPKMKTWLKRKMGEIVDVEDEKIKKNFANKVIQSDEVKIWKSKPLSQRSSINLKCRIFHTHHVIPSQMIIADLIPSKKVEPPNPQGFNPNASCEYHTGAIGHFTEDCDQLKSKVQYLINSRALKIFPHSYGVTTSSNGCQSRYSRRSQDAQVKSISN